MKFKSVLAAVIGFVAACCFQQQAVAGQTNVAVAANFTEAAKEIATSFQSKTGHVAVLSFGATGQLYAQITQSAPFEILLSADQARPEKAVEEGLAAPEGRFTYAIGKIVLWSRDPALVKGEETLKTAVFAKLAYCNPASAPYGAAAIETLKALHLFEKLQPKLVQGENILRRSNSSIRAMPSLALSPCRRSFETALARVGSFPRPSIRPFDRTPCY